MAAAGTRAAGPWPRRTDEWDEFYQILVCPPTGAADAQT